jgi:DNA-binding response OmpR family regulator
MIEEAARVTVHTLVSHPRIHSGYKAGKRTRNAVGQPVGGNGRNGDMRYVFGDYTLDAQRRELRCRGQSVPHRPKVFDLLVYLAMHHDRAISKQALLTHLWPNLHVSLTTLSTARHKYLLNIRLREQVLRP